jgi:para-aminobenzoate synthetase component I
MTLLKNYEHVINQMDTYYAQGKRFVFVINYNKTKGICELTEGLDSKILKFSINELEEKKSVPSYQFEITPNPYADYIKKFYQVMDEILNGNTYLANLTQASIIRTNLTLEEIYQYSRAKYKLYLKDEFVVFSPETFVKIENGKISTFPMKGTISADIPDSPSILLNDKKENEEHNTIVDLLRNDLSIVASKVHVSKFKYLDKIQTNKGQIWQMSSRIEGLIKPEFKIKPGQMFDKLLPAGSVTGAPKPKTISILENAEQYNRGFYTGVFGICDGEMIESAVMIRFIEFTDGDYYYKSGGGITSQSDPQKEYSELMQKIYVPFF